MNSPRLLPPAVASEIVLGVVNSAAFTLARMIACKKLDPTSIGNVEDLATLIKKLGRTKDDAFEIHLDRLPTKISIIRACLAQEDYESAVLLLFTAIEGEVNTALRMLLRIRGFSHGTISDVIRGTDFKAKLDVLLPLLGAKVPPRLRQFSRQSQTIRNLVVHFRANPARWSDEATSDGDYDSNQQQAKDFFKNNPLSRLGRDLSRFVDECVSSLPEVQDAIELLHRFREA